MTRTPTSAHIEALLKHANVNDAVLAISKDDGLWYLAYAWEAYGTEIVFSSIKPRLNEAVDEITAQLKEYDNV